MHQIKKQILNFSIYDTASSINIDMIVVMLIAVIMNDFPDNNGADDDDGNDGNDGNDCDDCDDDNYCNECDDR